MYIQSNIKWVTCKQWQENDERNALTRSRAIHRCKEFYSDKWSHFLQDIVLHAVVNKRILIFLCFCSRLLLRRSWRRWGRSGRSFSGSRHGEITRKKGTGTDCGHREQLHAAEHKLVDAGAVGIGSGSFVFGSWADIPPSKQTAKISEECTYNTKHLQLRNRKRTYNLRMTSTATGTLSSRRSAYCPGWMSTPCPLRTSGTVTVTSVRSIVLSLEKRWSGSGKSESAHWDVPVFINSWEQNICTINQCCLNINA